MVKSFSGLARFEDAPAKAVAQALPPAPPAIDVDAMLRQRDAMWQERIDSLQRQLDIMASMLAAQRRPAAYDFPIEYAADGSIRHIAAVPRVD